MLVIKFCIDDNNLLLIDLYHTISKRAWQPIVVWRWTCDSVAGDAVSGRG